MSRVATSARPLARPALGLALVAVLTAPALAACAKEAAAGTVMVTATDSECTPDVDDVQAGVRTFRITNTGSQVNELYILRADGSIVSERENVAPGTSQDLTVELPAGTYSVRCKPGMKGDGITSPFKVSGEAPATQTDPVLAKAVEDYTAYVTAQATASLGIAKDLRAAIAAGDLAKAKALYAPSRFGWESIEPVAEAFGDLDPKVDLREADLEEGQEWTGWHVIEKSLWDGGTTEGMTGYADDLITNLEDLVGRIPNAVITPTSMANGAKELLDEVATGKVTGEEEAFSHTDLVDFKANVDGAQKVFELLEPTVTAKDADLASRLDQRFSALQDLLAKYGSGTEFVSYDKVTEAQRQELSDAVNALAEPLSLLAAAVSS